MGDYEIREYRPGDEHALLEAFQAAREARAPGSPARTLAEWEWAYAKSPMGMRLVVALHAGRPVAQFAGQATRTRVYGYEKIFVHCLDWASHPDHAWSRAEPELFTALGKAFAKAYGGAERDWVDFGLPVGDEARLLDRFLRYEVVRNQVVLSREVGAGSGELPAGVRVLGRFGAEALALYGRCAGAWDASTIYDEHFLNWRFQDHPTLRYVPLGVPDEHGGLRGLAVVRHCDWPKPRTEAVAVWLVPPDEPQVAALLRSAVLAQARSDGAQRAAVIFPEWSPWFEEFQECDWWVHATERVMRARYFHRQARPEWLRGSWWYQLGDTDLV